MLKFNFVSVVAIIFVSLVFSAHAQSSPSKTVDCNTGGSIAKALKHARPGTTIYVKGFCQERVQIKRNRITLVGLGTAGLDGSSLDPSEFEFSPLIRISDVVGTTIKDLIVRNSPAEGLLLEGKASAKLQNVSALNNSNVGVLVDHARVVVEGGEYEGNQGGIDNTNGASAVLHGDISLQGNGVFGIAASSNASVEVRGASLNASGNQLAGVLIEGGALSLFNFGVTQNSQIIADNNGLCGFVLVGGGFLDVVAPPPFHFMGGYLLSASNNLGCGFLVATGSKIESPFGAATFQIEGNPAGMQVTGNSNVLINGGLQLINNFGPGLVGDGAGTITLAPAVSSPAPALPTVIENNGGPDVILNFGSRAKFATNVSVGSLVCDGTALVQGTPTCP